MLWKKIKEGRVGRVVGLSNRALNECLRSHLCKDLKEMLGAYHAFI